MEEISSSIILDRDVNNDQRMNENIRVSQLIIYATFVFCWND